MLNRKFRNSNILKTACSGLLIFLVAYGVGAQNCRLNSDNREWIEKTLVLWETVSRDSLRIESALPPWTLLFDENCVWHINPDLSFLTAKLTKDVAKQELRFEGKIVSVHGFDHAGNITLPDERQISPELLAFASLYDGGKKSYLVAAMPAIWQKAPHLKTETNLNILIRSVFIHEMTHTRHRIFFNSLNRIEKQNAFSNDFNDDFIQNQFGQKDDFRRDFENERNLLYRAAGEADWQKKLQLTKAALDLIQTRRNIFFTGKDQIFTQIEDIFLTMEGAANWAAYRSALAQGLSEADAVKLVRRGGKYWSQDEGFALFLLADSLSNGWQKTIFGTSEVSIVDLLLKSR